MINELVFSQPGSPHGFFKANRQSEAMELIRINPNAFVLLFVIADRARWHSGSNRFGLDIGEALIGDCQNYSLSEQEYRTAKEVLRKYNFATFKPTPKGTIAKLIDSSIFDISGEQPNEHINALITNGQRTGNGQPTTNKEGKKDKKDKKLGNAAGEPQPAFDQEQWLDGLQKAPAYQTIDVREQFSKAQQWCKIRHRRLTNRFFVGWLNRTEKPLVPTPTAETDGGWGAPI